MIVTLTMNPTIDKSSAVQNVVSEKKLRCDPPIHEPGGGGINVSRAISKLGGTSTAYYAAGGPAGQMLSDLLSGESVPHQAIPISGLTRQNLIIYEKSSGEQYRFGMPGPRVSDAEWQRCIDEIANIDPCPSYVVASGSLPPGVPDDFYGRLAARLQDCPTRVVVDTSGEALHRAAHQGMYLLKPNINELAHLAGRDEIGEEEDQEAVAHEIIDRGLCEVVVVSLGAQGVLLAAQGITKRFRAPSVPVRSKVGAGDSMVAGIVLALERGEPIENAVCFGVAAGTAAVMTDGSELCRRDDTERLYRKLLAGDHHT